MTKEGEEVGVIQPGKHNFDQGPDFLNAMITVDGIDFLFSALFFEKQKNRYSLAVFKDFLFRLGGSYLISGWQHAP